MNSNYISNTVKWTGYGFRSTSHYCQPIVDPWG